MGDRVPAGRSDAESRGAFDFDVFLSFASADRTAAERICRILRQGGLRVFWAPDTLEDSLGQSFIQAIEDRLVKSRHFVLFWTAQAKGSPWVRVEHEAFYSQCHLGARDARRLIILPDGRESISSLPLLLRSLQVAHSAEEVLARLGGGRAPSAKEPVAGSAIEGPLGLRMRFVPSGTYRIGSPAGEPGRDRSEKQHLVKLTRGFWLGETPITQGQWRTLVPGPAQPSYFKAGGDALPVESVNWYEATEFANRLSDREGLARCYQQVNRRGSLGGEGGRFTCDGTIFAGLDGSGYRLPTEAEWEIAARAGVATAIYTGGLTLRGERNGPELFPIAWYGGNSGVSYQGGVDSSSWPEVQVSSARSGPHPVGRKAPNGWGFRDLLGNVYEWTGDWFGDYPADLAVDPLGPPKGSLKVIRGGSWQSPTRIVRAACRSHNAPSFRVNSLGFRLARSHVPR